MGISKLIFIIIIINLPISLIIPHDEFKKILNGKLETFQYDPDDPDNDLDDIVVWMKDDASSIPIYFKNWSSEFFPYSISPSTCKTQIEEDFQIWHNGSSKFNFSETQTLNDGVKMSFGINAGSFMDPYSDGGITAMAVEYYGWNGYKHIYKVNTQFPVNQQIGSSEIIFNNTANFKSLYVWVNYTEDLESNQVCFKQIALHEIGHLLGLAHCVNEGSVMYDEYEAGTSFFGITQSDLDGLNILSIATIGQNGATTIETSPLIRFLSFKHFFFEYSPEILLFSQKQHENGKNTEGNPEHNSLIRTEKKLFILPENNKKEGVKK